MIYNIKYIHNVRNCGLLFAFDLDSKENRNKLVKILYENGVLCNPTRNNTIRFRPNLFVNKEEIIYLINILHKINL